VCKEGAATKPLEALGIEVIRLPNLEATAIAKALGQRKLMRVLVEGGGQVAASFLKAGLVDRISLYRAGIALGGDSRSAVAALGLDKIGSAPRFALHSSRAVGGDTLETWRRGA
jgi:diaminohydroxyphosphoribosylaminopyrimidine deaminase/5-amino-6-(5-phosphoribosylamino)uracil reductase